MAGPTRTTTDPVVTSERVAEEIDTADELLAKLQVTYEKYFVGIERRAPDRDRKDVSDRIRRLRTAQVRNTALKFRVQTLFAKLISFERMWDRVLREMEEGTYRRDLFKARYRNRQRHGGKRPDGSDEESLPEAQTLDDGDEHQEHHEHHEHRPPARPPPPPSIGVSDESMRRLFHTYLKARQQCGESTAGITYEAVASKIRSQVPALMEKHNAKNVDFKVVIKGGRAILKAVPKV